MFIFDLFKVTYDKEMGAVRFQSFVSTYDIMSFQNTQPYVRKNRYDLP